MQKKGLIKIDSLPIGLTFTESGYYSLRIDGSTARGFDCQENDCYYEHVKYADGKEEWFMEEIDMSPIYGGMGFC
jgi:hypothetical protein